MHSLENWDISRSIDKLDQLVSLDGTAGGPSNARLLLWEMLLTEK